MKGTKDKKSEGQVMKSMNNQVQNGRMTKDEKDEQRKTNKKGCRV